MKWKLACVALLAIPAIASANVVLSITGPGGATSNQYPLGTTQFTVQFHLSSTVPWVAMGAGLEDLGGSGRLSIKGRTTGQSDPALGPIAGANTGNATLFGVAGVLDPVSANIGYFDSENAADNYPATADILISTMTIKNGTTPANNAPIAPGTYVLQIGNPGGGINAGNLANQSIPTSVGQPYTVTILPEPASLLLLGLGGLFLRRRR